MKKILFCSAFTAAFLLSGCANSPAHRIAECQKKGGTKEACNAEEWAYEKAHPLPKFSASVDNASALQTALDSSTPAK